MDEQVRALLISKEREYNCKGFIADDPISIPHLFSKKEDVEISGFLSASIAWGQRKTILKNASRLMELMDHAPHDFICSFTAKDLKPFKTFVHRTFNGEDCLYFLHSLRNIYLNHGGLENVFAKGLKKEDENIKNAIIHFRKIFGQKKTTRSMKHISDPEKNSAAKRICMYLRWMVRNDKKGCDFGIWKKIHPSKLCLPLDVHTGNVARELKLLERKQDDWKAVEEITARLKLIDASDPVKFDFALFGMGVNSDLSYKMK